MFLFFPLSLFVQRLSTICTHCFNFFFAIISFAWTGVSETDLRDVRGAGHQESAVSTGRCSRRLYCQRPRAGPEIFKDSWKFRVWRAFAKITNVQIFVWSYIYIYFYIKHASKIEDDLIWSFLISPKMYVFFWLSQLRQLFAFCLFTPCFFPSLSPILDGLLGTPQVFRSKLHSFLMILGFRDRWWM